jgi:ATP-dependent DNA helicase DinG
MVREDEMQLIRQCIDAMREGVPGFRSRRVQMKMIATAANTLARRLADDEPAGSGEDHAKGSTTPRGAE